MARIEHDYDELAHRYQGALRIILAACLDTRDRTDTLHPLISAEILEIAMGIEDCEPADAMRVAGRHLIQFLAASTELFVRMLRVDGQTEEDVVTEVWIELQRLLGVVELNNHLDATADEPLTPDEDAGPGGN
jgi:hypothetical protein